MLKKWLENSMLTMDTSKKIEPSKFLNGIRLAYVVILLVQAANAPVQYIMVSLRVQTITPQ